MLFVHLIYVLANYIGVLVLLAEKCRVFFFSFVKTEENKSTQHLTLSLEIRLDLNNTHQT